MGRSAQPSERSALIVEDEHLIAGVVEEMLRDLGYTDIHHADTIQTALTLIDRLRPQIVVLDASLKGIAAYSVAKRLKEEGIPFIVATGFDLERLPPEFRFGVSLRKPYALSDLEAAIAKATSRSP